MATFVEGSLLAAFIADIFLLVCVTIWGFVYFRHHNFWTEFLPSSVAMKNSTVLGIVCLFIAMPIVIMDGVAYSESNTAERSYLNKLTATGFVFSVIIMIATLALSFSCSVDMKDGLRFALMLQGMVATACALFHIQAMSG